MPAGPAACLRAWFYLHVGFTDPHRPYRPGAFTPPHDPAKVAVPTYLPDTPEVRREPARGWIKQLPADFFSQRLSQTHASDAVYSAG
ncbi:MAG: hypothetical protein ACREEM_27835 [Blastocatellia bacterium]